jgi:hypothetical protein
MYDQLRSEYELAKRSAIQPTNNYYLGRPQPELFSGIPNIMNGGDHLRQGISDRKTQLIFSTFYSLSLILGVESVICIRNSYFDYAVSPMLSSYLGVT